MNERINKNHPDYPEYISKCKSIYNQYYLKAKKIRDSITLQLDGPETAIWKEYGQKINELKKEYSFLFE